MASHSTQNPFCLGRYDGLAPGGKIDGWTWSGEEEIPMEEELDEEQKEMVLQDHRERCQEALKHYKATTGEDYELVNFVKGELVTLGPYTCWHFNFEAKNRADNSTKLCFAEFCETTIRGDREICVNHCDVLDPCTAVRGCVICEDSMLHPRNHEINYPDFGVRQRGLAHLFEF